MPTYGWILEGDLEAFFEGTERIDDPGPPLPPSFQCPFCTAVMGAKSQLQDHVSANHHVARPILLLGNQEPARSSIIRSRKFDQDIVVANATTASVAFDGGKATSRPANKIASLLSKIKQGEVSVTLVNDSQINAAPVTTPYKISFRIANPQELKEVELAFSDKIMSAPLSRASIGAFLNDPKCQGAGSDYADGLATYAMGVLLKERPASEQLTTPFARYRESYGSALQVLSDFSRPFARLISEVIRFALNDFAAVRAPTGYWELVD